MSSRYTPKSLGIGHLTGYDGPKSPLDGVGQNEIDGSSKVIFEMEFEIHVVVERLFTKLNQGVYVTVCRTGSAFIIGASSPGSRYEPRHRYSVLTHVRGHSQLTGER